MGVRACKCPPSELYLQLPSLVVKFNHKLKKHLEDGEEVQPNSNTSLLRESLEETVDVYDDLCQVFTAKRCKRFRRPSASAFFIFFIFIFFLTNLFSAVEAKKKKRERKQLAGLICCQQY